MARWLNGIATVVLGIVPATFTLLANALYYLRALDAIQAGITVEVEWGEIAFLVLIGAAGALGYVSLFFAAAGRVDGRVAVGLLVGVAALASAIWLGLTPYWLGTPLVVALAHVAIYWTRRRSFARAQAP
jgi:hypothetical protein